MPLLNYRTDTSFMSTAVLVAAVVGGGVLLLLRRLFPAQKVSKLLRYPADAMRGKTVIVTGANCGIGKALAGELLKLQARVVMACRDRQSAEEAARDIQRQAGPEQGEVVVKQLDLASLTSVRRFCEEIKEVGPTRVGWTGCLLDSEAIFFFFAFGGVDLGCVVVRSPIVPQYKGEYHVPLGCRCSDQRYCPWC